MDRNELLIIFSFASFIFFIFPVYVRFDFYLDAWKNKLYFSFYLYGFIKAVGGYAQLAKGGSVLHISKKKAIFLPYGEMENERKRFEITRGFQVIKAHFITELGSEKFPEISIIASSLIQTVSHNIFAILCNNRPFLSMKSGLVYYSEEEIIKISGETITVFNGLTITVAFIKILITKGLGLWQKLKKKLKNKKKLKV